MILDIFKFICIIFMFLIVYNIFRYVSDINLVEKFKIGIQHNASNNASLTYEQNASKIDIHDSNISASDIRSIFDTKNIENASNVIMDLKDNYINLCPLDYNINMIKLQNMATKINQYPVYTDNVFIDLTRQIKSDKPLPTTADFFK